MPASQPNPKIDTFLSKADKWRAEMEALRAILLDCGLTEELKWYQPCYSHEGSNVVLIGAFKNYCALLVCKGALLKDPKGILIQPTENSQAGRQIRFTSVQEIAAMKSTLKACMREAMAVAKAGLDITYKKTSEFKMPEELEKRLARDAAFKKAFHALTPGRQRGYILHFSAAQQSATRDARIDKYTPQILKGLGIHDVNRAPKK